MKIEARNLRSIGVPFAIDIDDKMVLQGANGTGKSTMAKVPYFVMTGKGLSIKNGETECYGKIEFDGISIVREKKNGVTNIRVNGKSCSETAMHEHLKMRNYNPDVLSTLFNTETVLDGETMLKVASMELGVEKVLSFTNLDEECKKYVRKYFDDAQVSLLTIPIINKAHQKFYTMRTENNRIVKNLKTILANMPYTIDQEIPDTSVYVSLNEQLNTKKSDLIKTIAIAESDIKKRDFLLNQISKMQDKRKSLILVSEEEIQKMHLLIVEISEKIEKLEDDKKVNAENKKATEKEISELISTLSEIKSQYVVVVEKGKAKKETLTTLQNTTCCPLYAGLTCTTNMSEVCTSLEKELEVLRKECETLNTKISEITKEIESKKNLKMQISVKEEEIVKEIISLNKEHQHYRSEREKAINIINQAKDVDCDIQNFEAELKALNIKDVEKEKEELLKVEGEISTINAKISDLNKIIKEIVDFKNKTKALADYELVSERYTIIIKELQTLPNKIFEKIIVPIENKINSILEEVKDDWQIKFDFSEKELAIYVNTKNGKINIEELSTGERIIVNYVFKSLICDMIKFNTIILDNTDALDEKHFANVEDVVSKSKYNTMLITCANTKSNFKIHKM